MKVNPINPIDKTIFNIKSNPNRQILVSNFIQWNEYRRGKNLQKYSNQYKKAKEIGVEYKISDETRKKLSKSSSGRVYSKEYKENLSKKMKEVAQNNPKYSYSKNKYFKNKKAFRIFYITIIV